MLLARAAFHAKASLQPAGQPHPRHTHAVHRKHPGPAPQPRRVWENPEEATREAMLQFIDPYERDPDLGAPGRRWRAAEIRLKSNEDLQKLWIVLLKERNMLHTTRMLHKKRKTQMPHGERIAAVRKSMAMIKLVLHERTCEKAARDLQLAAKLTQERSLAQTDLRASEVWPPWIPGHPRDLPLAALHTFTVVLRTVDLEKPAVVPPADALSFTFKHAGEPIAPKHIGMRVHVYPPAPSRPSELTYACHVQMSGHAIPKSLFVVSEVELADAVEVSLECELYGEPIGEPVPVRVLPSKRTRRTVGLARIDQQMSAMLREKAQAAGRDY